jgi:long-chain acyl-CoA synthetase
MENVIQFESTLPQLLEQACERNPNLTAFNQFTETGWQSLSNQTLQSRSEAIALGLLDLGLEAGDRVAFLMASDVTFVLTDMACLLANLVDVPIDLSQTIENILFSLRHSAAKLLIVATGDLLQQIAPYLKQIPALQYVVIASGQSDYPVISSWEHDSVAGAVPILSLNRIESQGQAQISAEKLVLRQAQPADLATIIYIPDPDGQLVGVMLTHRNLAGNALATFASLPELGWGETERALTFLPLTHLFARCLLYGHLYYGHSVYFSSPSRILKHLQEVQPTLLATVPLLIEKLYSKILEQGQRQPGWKRWGFALALSLARRYQLGQKPRGLYAVGLKMADRFVLSQWRALFGGNLKYLLSGGAALKPELANLCAAAGVEILQGYGLTQAGIVACNSSAINRAGTVGKPIAGVEIKLATDREILVRGAYVFPGYYQNPTATAAAIDPQGWLHTGDLGAFTPEGLLQITGLKKALFKLATGKYIAPRPIEMRLSELPLIKRATVVGANQKFCAALVVPDLEMLREALRQQTQSTIANCDDQSLLQHPCTLALYQSAIEAANCHLPYWAGVRRFRLIHPQVSLTPDLLAVETAALYQEHRSTGRKLTKQFTQSPIALTPLESCPHAATATCPTVAQSLHPRFTT